MFARQIFRPARNVQNQVRRYASESPKSGGATGILVLGGAAAAGVGAATWWYSTANAKGQAKELSQHVKGNRPAGSGEAKKAFLGGDQGFVSLALEDVQTINHNTKKLRFKLPEEDMVSGLPVASAVITKHKGPEMEKPVIRPYTPVSDEDEPGHMDFVIKSYPNGPMSQHLVNMIPGQRLDIKGPIPKYQWETNKHDHIVMIAGGTGTTPMYQLARRIFNDPADKTKVTFVFGNVTEEDILLKDEWSQLENTYPQRFKAFYVLDNPPKGWQQGKGFVTKDLLKTVMPEPKEGDKIKIFVCGPPPMYKAISGMKKSPQDQGELDGYLKELGYNKDQVYKF